MKALRQGLSILFATVAAISGAVTPRDVVDALSTPTCRSGNVRYEVLLPSAADPVVYDITLSSGPAGSDTLAPCRYLIDWTLHRGNKTLHGFNSYGDGHHFRFRDTKLQEYHFSDDAAPFRTAGGGVQGQAQFADLLPQFVGRHLAEILSDTTYSARWNENSLTLSGTQRIKGYDVLNFDYRFDHTTLLPVSITMEYNPASISEQSVTVYYTWDKDGQCPEVDESALADPYADVFDRFRTSSFRIDNMRGAELPGFTGLTPTRERYSRQRGDIMAAPTVLLFLDPAVQSSSAAVTDVRRAVASLPSAADVLYIFADSASDEIETLTGQPQPGENILTNCRTLMRELGVTDTPTLILVGTDGVIRDVIVGVNKQLSDIVIQKMMLVD